MSTRRFYSALLSTAFLLSSAALLHPASAQVNPMNTRTVPSENPDAGVGDNPQAMRDNAFLKRASEGGMGEIQLSQLAAQKASSDDVKKLARKLVADHTYLAEQFKPLDDAAHIAPPKKLAKNDQKELDKLNGLSGPAFDKEFLTYMAKIHHRDLDDFRTEQKATPNARLGATATSGGDMIQQHLDMIDKLNS